MLQNFSNLPKKNLVIAGFIDLALILTLGFLASRYNSQANLAKSEFLSSVSSF